jgi:hypothetical protein
MSISSIGSDLQHLSGNDVACTEDAPRIKVKRCSRSRQRNIPEVQEIIASVTGRVSLRRCVLGRHFGHFQKHGVRKNDASILVTDDDTPVERFKNASHLMKPLRLSCWYETSPIVICESDVRLFPVNVTTGKNLTALEGWRIL